MIHIFRSIILWLYLLVFTGCATEAEPATHSQSYYETPWAACKKYDFVIKSCQDNPIKAICSAEYGYNKDVCLETSAVAASHYNWCLKNTPGDWLGSECPGYICLFLLEDSQQLCI